MSNYRVKSIKRRPIDSRERLPSETDTSDGKVFVFFGGSPRWRAISLTVVLLWAKRYTLYWAPSR
jgi:hypothetical protein